MSAKQFLLDLVLGNAWSKHNTDYLLATTKDSKICRCGKVYPLNALPPTKEASGVVYFDCACKAIVFIPLQALGRTLTK